MIQKGTTVVVGFNGRTVGTWVMEDSGESPGAEVTVIKGSNNSTLTKLISDPKKTYKATGILLAADLTAMAAAKIGDTISINSVSCMIESLDLSFGREAARASLTAVKEDSMTYT